MPCDPRPGYSGTCHSLGGRRFLQECPNDPGWYRCKLFDAKGAEVRTLSGMGDPARATMLAEAYIAEHGGV